MKRVATPPKTDAFYDPKRRTMLEQISEDGPSLLGLFRRVYGPKSTRSQAIKAKCLECCWLDRADIRECTASECPLWGSRPYRTPKRKPQLDR